MTKEKIKHFVILFFSLVLTLSVFSQVEPKATSDVAFGSGKNLQPNTYNPASSAGRLQPSDWLYYKSSNDLSAYLGKKSSNLPTVRYQKNNDYLQFSLNNVSTTTSPSLETNTKTPNTPTLFYRNAFNDTDVTYQITNIPFKVKEEIVLKKFPISNFQFPINDQISNDLISKQIQFLFSAETSAKPVKQDDGSIAFFGDNGDYLFQLDKPFMYDAKGTRSEEVSIEIVPVGETKLSQRNKSSNSQFAISNFQSITNDSIFKPILDIFSSLKISNWKFIDNWPLKIENSKPQSYQIILKADTDWLSTATYPVIIDPTVTHNTDAQFNGQYNRVSDSNSSTDAVQLESSYPEATKDPYTVLLLHFNEANGTTVGITDMTSSTRVITANGNASTTSYVTQLGLGNAAAFDGTTDYFSIPDSSDFDLTSTDGSIDFWIYAPIITSGDKTIITQSVTGADSQWGITIRGANKYIAVDLQGGAEIITPNNSIVAGIWQHVAVVKSGSNTSVFINGILQAVGTATVWNNSSNSLYIGAIGDTSEAFNGYLDEFRILKGRALTPEEIKAAASRRPYAVYTSPVIDATASVAWDTVNWTEGGVNTGDGETLYNTSGLVAQWNFNETSGTTATSSTSGSCVTCAGTLTNFASTASQDQAAGTGWTANNKRWGAGALMFDGTNDYVDIGSGAVSLSGFTAFTATMWVNQSSIVGGDASALISNDQAGNSPYVFYVNTSRQPYWYLNTANGTFNVTSPVSIDFGKWNFLTYVYNGSTMSIYVNGIFATSTSATGTMDTAANAVMRIGMRSDGLLPFNGIIDSTAIYSRALSSAEILSNYQAGNIEIQTRTGATSDPNDGSWEAWKPTTEETQLLNMNSDAGNWHSDIMASTTIATSTESTIKMEGTGSLKIETGKASTTAGTVALWHFEETGTTTGTTLYDSTANAKNGTTNGTPTIIDGIFGKARSFDGVDDYVNIGSSVTTATDNFTLSAWFKVPSMTPAERVAMMIIQNGNNSGGYGVGFNSDGTNGYIGGIYNGIVWQGFSTNGLTGASGLYNLSPSPDVWHHVALIRRNGANEGWFDGVYYPVYYPTTAPAAVANAAAVGKGATNAAGAAAADVYFKGSIDEPLVLNRALSADEIAETYRMGANHHLTREISATNLSAQTKLSFWIGADRPGTYLEAMLGESDYSNYELASSTAALSANTVLYIKGDEIANSTSIKDSSFSGKAITANGNARTTGNGKIGNAVAFDGTGDYLRVSVASDWKFLHGAEDTTGFKWSYDEWVSINSFASRNVLLATGYNVNNARLELTIETNRNFRIELQNATESGLSVASGGIGVYPNDSNWHHIAVTYDHSLGSNNLKWYLDGVLVSSANKSGTPSTGDPQHTLSIGEQAGQAWTFNGKRDELRIFKNQVLTADQIRQAYEYGLRTHPITIDFGATLQPADLISSATDYNFSITATTSGLSATTSGLYLGDKIIIKENLGGTEYTTQGTVNSINTATGAITVPSWDTGSTFPASNGYSPNATVFKWQREYFDITGAATTTRDAITNLTLRPTNGAEGRTIYLDDFRYNTNYLTASSSSAITSSENRYLQYRAIFTSTDTFVSPFLTAFNTLYTALANSFPSLIGISGGGFLSF